MPLRPCRLSIRTKTASCLRRSTVPWGAVPAAVVVEKVVVRKGAVLKQVDPVEAKRADMVVRDVAPVADREDRAVGRVALVAVEVGKAVRKGAVLKQVDLVEAKKVDLVVRDVAPVAVKVEKAVPVDEAQVVPAVARE